MKDIIKNIFQYLKNKPTMIIIVIVVFGLIISFGIPTLARYRKRNNILDVTVWNGEVASSYRSGSGTINDPYVISNGGELAYFAEQLENINYENTYFTLEKDIVLNKGIFEYQDDNVVRYLLDNVTYYLDVNTNIYYDSLDDAKLEKGNVNLFKSLKNFKGYFNGNAHTIYGLYINSNSEEVALFTNLNGVVEDLYIDNSLIYGGNVTAGVASLATKSEIKNVFFDGVVVGSKEYKVDTKIIDIEDITVEDDKNIKEIVNIELPFINGNIKEIKLVGNIDVSTDILNQEIIKINNQIIDSNEFTIDLSELKNEIVLEILFEELEELVSIQFNNLKYSVTYEYSNAAGIVSNAVDTTIENCVNKADIYGSMYASGIVNASSNSKISNSYNTGLINSNNYASGIINNIINTDNFNIKNIYNSGVINGMTESGLITSVMNSSFTISNSFNTDNTEYNILNAKNSYVTVENSYLISGSSIKDGNIIGFFDNITLEELCNKDFMTENLLYDEFIDLDNLNVFYDAVWVYQNDKLPILYIDDATDAVASIFISNYAWNNLGYDLNNIIINSNLTFNIQAIDELKPLKQVEYYIHNSSKALNRAEIEAIDSWKEYDSIVSINEEGFYVIYVKIIDSDDNISYLNTDLLILDLSGALIKINLDSKTWESNNSNLKYYYINSPNSVTVSASDMLSGLASLNYYVSEKILTNEELISISDENWKPYNSPISINKGEKKIVYVKATDNAAFVTYANTDYIIYNGYSVNNIILGKNTPSNLSNVYITDKSSLSLEFSYSDEVGYSDGYTHNLISNILLPVNTELTLVDKINSSVYKYKITSSDDSYGYLVNGYATYPLTLFKNTKVSIDEFFKESDYYKANNIIEKFKLTLDFSNTNLNQNYDDIRIYMTVNDNSGNVVRNTYKDEIKAFNVYGLVNDFSTKATTYLNVDFTGESIIYNEESETDVLITTGLNYSYVGVNKVYDTTYEDMNMGLMIKFVDSDGNLVNKKHLKNLLIKIDDNEYAVDSDGIYRISLDSGVDSISKTIKFITAEDNLKLPLGEYSFIISNYVAYDGRYTNSFSNNEKIIPVLVTNSNYNIRYNFDVIMDDASRVIDKNNSLQTIKFSVIQSGLENPNIRISLYKKDELTAYNQDYSLVDISDYINNSLIKIKDNNYYLTTNPIKYNGTTDSLNNFELDLKHQNFENTGYKLMFELYDGSRKIGVIEKSIIIK